MRLFPFFSLFHRILLKMAQLDDKITALGVSVDAAAARVQVDIQSLKDQLAAGATADQLAALDALKVKVDAIDPAP
jgi:predicted acetyltransferase